VKKIAIPMMVLMLTALASAAVAGDKGEAMNGRLFLFQKCDSSLIPDPTDLAPQYDSSGCPLPGYGPWPIIPDNRRWGQMKYNLLGPEFKFSFQGKNLEPDTDYQLIYYPDPWPGTSLICLGGGTTNAKGNVQIHGTMEILSGLPAPYDANFNPVAPSGAVGAKIWAVPAADVACAAGVDATGAATPTQLLGWNPAKYLFEANMIVYQYVDPATVASANADDEDEEFDADDEQLEVVSAPAPAPQGNGNGGNGNNGNNGNGGSNGNGKKK